MMISRKELEEILGTKISDEAWAYNQKVISEAEDKMWEEDHPLDD